MTPVVKCPQCRQRGLWFEAKWGPFCSERCKLLDLGRWFSEENKVSSPLTADHLEDYEALPNGPHLDLPETNT